MQSMSVYFFSCSNDASYATGSDSRDPVQSGWIDVCNKRQSQLESCNGQMQVQGTDADADAMFALGANQTEPSDAADDAADAPKRCKSASASATPQDLRAAQELSFGCSSQSNHTHPSSHQLSTLAGHCR